MLQVSFFFFFSHLSFFPNLIENHKKKKTRPWIPDRSAIEGVKGVSEKDLFEGVKYSVIKNNKLIRVEIKKGEANLSMEQYEKYPLSDEKIEFYGKEYNLKPNQKLNIKF